MKNNEEFRASVFERAAEYEKKRKEKRKERVRVALALMLTVLVFVPLLYIPLDHAMGGFPFFGNNSASTTLDPLHGIMGIGTEATTCDASENAVCTTEAKTDIGINGTTVHETTPMYTQTTVTQTTGTTAAATSTGTPAPSQGTGGERAEFNAAVCLGEAYGAEAHFRAFKSKEELLAYSASGNVRDLADTYLGDGFWEKNALVAVCLELDADLTPHSKAYVYEGELLFDIELSRGKEAGAGKQVWLIVAGVARELAAEDLRVTIEIRTELERK